MVRYDGVARFLDQGDQFRVDQPGEDVEAEAESGYTLETPINSMELANTRSHWEQNITMEASTHTFLSTEKSPQNINHISETTFVTDAINCKTPNTNRTHGEILRSSAAKPLLLALPRELRDSIYSLVYESQSHYERCMIIGARRLFALRHDSSLLVLARFLGAAPITRTNMQLAEEYAECILKTKCIFIHGGPESLHYFFRYLDKSHLQWIRSIEMDWLTMPLELYDRIINAEEREIWPLFRYIKEHTNIKAITIPLHFFEVRGTFGSLQHRSSRETRVFRQSRNDVLQYWAVMGANALSLLLHDILDQVVIRIRPYDTWCLLSPAVKVQDLAKEPWERWNMNGEASCLRNLQDALDCRRDIRVDIRELVVAVKLQPWSEEDMGEELLVTMRKPARL
jgi:hypothetical protein